MFGKSKLSLYQVNPSGGKIFVDRKVQTWLDSFSTHEDGKKSDQEWAIYRQITKEGFDEDESVAEPTEVPKISLVVVLFNSARWIENLNKMFALLAPWLHEVLVVDNGSKDSCLQGIDTNMEIIRKITLSDSVSFAAAVNQGVRAAQGDLFLLINPDIWIPRSSLWSLIHFYAKHSDAAAIAPKLMLMQTPGFINSIGNHVPLFRWGYDLGLGHLDMGQFDHIREIEAACFATVLIPREKWELVGELDEEYPMYYEDSDWCFRARDQGLLILIDVCSKVYHFFGSNHEGKKILTGKKLIDASYGRLRYVKKNLSSTSTFLYLTSYILFDIIFLIFSLFRLHSENIGLIINAWKKLLSDNLHLDRLVIKQVANSKVLPDQKKIEASNTSIFRGLPAIKKHDIISYKKFHSKVENV